MYEKVNFYILSNWTIFNKHIVIPCINKIEIQPSYIKAHIDLNIILCLTNLSWEKSIFLPASESASSCFCFWQHFLFPSYFLHSSLSFKDLALAYQILCFLNQHHHKLGVGGLDNADLAVHRLVYFFNNQTASWSSKFLKLKLCLFVSFLTFFCSDSFKSSY